MPPDPSKTSPNCCRCAEDVHVATIQKNRSDQIRVGLVTRGGARGVDIRLYEGDGNGGHKKTPVGIILKPSLITALIAALHRVPR